MLQLNNEEEVVDVSPELLAKVQELYEKRINKDPLIKSTLVKVENGGITMKGVQDFSQKLGEILGETFKDVFTEDNLPNGTLYYNIAESIVPTMIKQNHELVNNVAVAMQRQYDKKDNIGIPPQRAKINEERVQGIVKDATADVENLKESIERLYVNTENITESFWDDFVETNVAFKYNLGYQPQVIRICVGANPCQWCQDLAGEYDYEEAKASGEVFARHKDCECQIIYKNNEKQYMENVHTKTIVTSKDSNGYKRLFDYNQRLK